MKYKKITILILVFTLILNFIFVPKKVEASAIALAGGKAIFLFLLGALGITVATQTDLEGLYGAFDWDSMITSKHINIGDYNKPPDEPPNYNKLLKAIIAGGTAVAIGFSGLLDDIKEWLQGLDATEGENSILEEDWEMDGTAYKLGLGEIYKQYWSAEGITRRVEYRIEFINNKYWLLYSRFNADTNASLGSGTCQEVVDGLIANNDNINDPYIEFKIDLANEHNIEKYITYNITHNSTVITNIPPTTIPQPDISVVPGIQEVITPEGQKKYIYPGTMDDLLDDLKQNISWQDLLGSINSSISYTATETQQGVEIDFGTSTETPYPDIDTEPIEDVSQFQGENIGLLKSIVNWLSNIRNEIVNLGDKIDNKFEEEEPKEIDFSPITEISLTDKFPFSLPWDLRDSISLLASEGEAPIWEIPLVTETITIDMSEFEVIASIARVFNTLLFIIGLIILTRRFI